MESNINKTLYRIIKIAATILIALVVVYGTIRASLVAFDFGYRVFTEPPMDEVPGVTVVVTIDEDMGAMDIADYLLEKGLIRDTHLFWLQYQLSAYRGDINPGTYSLNTSMTAKEMMIIMAEVEEETETDEEEADSTETTESTEADSQVTE